MDEIVDGVRRVVGIMAEIAAASKEQDSDIAHVSGTVSDMDAVTQQNAELVEQAAAAAAQLKDQSASLAHAVRIFKIGGGAHEASPLFHRQLAAQGLLQLPVPSPG